MFPSFLHLPVYSSSSTFLHVSTEFFIIFILVVTLVGSVYVCVSVSMYVLVCMNECTCVPVGLCAVTRVYVCVCR